jgi:succinate-semialdehyde dehydrogenase/glutarate-semialdehyde dehydrogenase
MERLYTRFQSVWELTPNPHLEQIAVQDPATQTILGYVNLTPSADWPVIVERAQSSQQFLAKQTASERAEQLRCWYELIVENKALLAQLVTLESGKPLPEAEAEVGYAAGFVAWFSEEAKRAYGQQIPSTSVNQKLTTIKQPVGVVFGITPWNFPLAMITRKVAPAFAAGCSFILKPSELTPLSAIALQQLAIEAGFAADALQIVHTDTPKELAAYFCQHPKIQKITFTGSTNVGRSLLEQSASSIKRVSLELGGNAPFIVFPSADLDKAVDGLMVAKFRNAGQTCVAANRVFVAKACYDVFLDKLTQRVERLYYGHGFTAGVTVGPLISMRAKERLQATVNEALLEGATLHFQAVLDSPLAEGQFFPATILTNVTQSMAIAQQELFGPVLSVIVFDAEEEVVGFANAVPEGLASYFYSEHVNQIERVANALAYGMVGINTGAISNPVAPFGGVKQSGLGREGAQEGLEEYLEIKYLCQSFSEK